MNDERYKQLMESVGMPNSRSLLQALRQAVNETEQECRASLINEKRDELLERVEALETSFIEDNFGMATCLNRDSVLEIIKEICNE